MLDISVPPTDRPGWLQDAKSEPFLAQGADLLARAAARNPCRSKSAAAIDGSQHALEPGPGGARGDGRAVELRPRPIPPKPADTPAPAYKPGEQRDLDRLINNAR